MGSITRNFANNLTTSGLLKPTAFNNDSFDNVTSVSEGAIVGGNMVLLSTQNPSAVSSVSFTTGIDSTYKEYIFMFSSIHADSGGASNYFTFNASTDGGSNYNVNKTTTSFANYNDEAGAGTHFFGYVANNDLAGSTSYQDLITFRQNDAETDENYGGFLHIFDPASTTYVKHFISYGAHSNSGSFAVNNHIAGYLNTTSAVNAIDFKFDTGSNFTGTIQLFGIS